MQRHRGINVMLATATRKGQVTMPAATRKAAGLQPGDRVLFLVEGERISLIPVSQRPLRELKGSLASEPPVTVTDSSEAR